MTITGGVDREGFENALASARTEPRYGWWGWEAETDFENDDDRENVYFLTITDGGEEMAVIMHRTLPQPDGTEKYPLDGSNAQGKIERAKTIVAALNAYQEVS